MYKFRNRKAKYVIHNRRVNRLILRLRPKGGKLYTVYDFVVIKKNQKRSLGRALVKLGVYNPNLTDRFLFINSTKLYFWLRRGIIIHKNIKRYIIKFLHPKLY